MLPPELTTRVAVYRQATGHDEITAIHRILEMGMDKWETDPDYMPERTCGRVRTITRGRSGRSS